MNFEIRSQSSPIRIEGRKLYGTAIPYNSDSHDLGGFTERFMPGSVAETIKSGQIEICLYHDRTMPLGSQAGGSLKLIDSPTGLNYECDLPDTSYANDFRAMMTGGRKDIGGTSFGFRPTEDGQTWKRENGKNIREINKAQLDHISPVVTPAYPASTAQLRSLGNVDALDAYGFDLDKLAKIFVSIKRGLAIEQVEMELARLVISQLRDAIQTPKLAKAMDAASRLLL